MTKTLKIYVKGFQGMVGFRIWRALKVKGYTNLVRSISAELDLRNRDSYMLSVLGWVPQYSLEAGIKNAYAWCNSDQEDYKKVKL